MNKMTVFYRNPSIYLACIVFIIASFVSCKDKTKNTNKVDFWTKRFSIIKDLDSITLYNRKLENIAEILGDDMPSISDSFILYYFSVYDCDECLFFGFDLIKKFQNIPYPVIVVASDGSIGEIRKKYDFNNYIYIDRDYLLNKQLNRTSTPIFIKLDSNHQILCTYHPDKLYDKNQIDLKIFLEHR